jgi:tetratricopeptide (TPR) repeat protein
LQGRIVGGDSFSYNALVVEVTNLDGHTIRESRSVSSDGLFRFERLPVGDYEIRVKTFYGEDIASTVATVGALGAPVEISLPESKVPKPPAGTVSIKKLMHPPSKQVQKLLNNGQRLFEQQHYDDAIAQFRRALKDDPACPQAHAELGMVFSKLAKWDEAASEYREAVALDPDDSMLHNNLGVTLAMLKRFPEAESETATAVKLDPSNARAHFVLAALLLQKPGNLSEAVRHLVSAEARVPEAKSYIEKICAVQHVAGCP